MLEKFKTAILDNLGKSIAAVIVSCMLAIITVSIIEPVKEVITFPQRVIHWQKGVEERQLQFEKNQIDFIKALHEKTRTDSAIFRKLQIINESNQEIKTEMAVVKTKLSTIRDELPALHQRFNDIENTVKNSKSLGDYALEYKSINKYMYDETTN